MCSCTSRRPSELPRELERNFKINDKVLRYLVIRYEGELPAKREPLKPYVAREAAPAQAAEEKPAGGRRGSRRGSRRRPKPPLTRRLPYPRPNNRQVQVEAMNKAILIGNLAQ